MLSHRTIKSLPKTIRNSNVIFKTLRNASTFKVQNPYTHETHCEYHYKSASEIQTIVKDAFKSHREWKRLPLEERIKVVQKAAEYFTQNQDAIAKDITCQMGKPITQSIAELKGFHNVVKKLIQIAPEALAEKVVKDAPDGILKYTREPIGVAAIFSPWNYPVLTCANLVIASVLAGNSVVIKHSPLTPLIAKHFEDSFKYAGVENIVRDLMIVPEDALKLYLMPEIGFVSFTGSTETGKEVQRQITQDKFINITMELGSNDAVYVAEDADIDYAAKELVTGALYNAGQSCNGTARIYVHKSLYQDFLDKVVKYVSEYKMGDPLKEETSLGPLAQGHKLEEMKQNIEEAVKQGAKVLTGGLPTKDAEEKGQFFQPTVVADVRNDMQFVLKETFGPVVGIAPTEGDEEAIKLINDSQYGLTAAVFSKNQKRIEQITKQLSVGTVYGNRVMHVDPQLPWSGRNNSGNGASLSVLGFHEVTRPKSYNIKLNM